MKAADLVIGGEYFYQATGWGTEYKAVILEAPIVGWKMQYRYGYYGRQKGVENWDPKARKDHAKVKLFKRDYRGAEDGTKFQRFVGIERVMLRNIHEEFDQWRMHQQAKEQRKAEAKTDAKAKKARAGILNERLEALGLELHDISGWHLRAVADAATTDRTLDRDWRLLHAIENLLDEVSA